MRAILSLKILCLGFALTFGAAICSGQVVTGAPPFGSFGGGPDVINLGNLNVHLSIPIVSKAGRGLPFTYNLAYDSSVYYPSSVSGTNTWTPVFNWGWSSSAAGTTGYMSNTSSSVTCYYKQGNLQLPGSLHQSQTNFVYHDPWGVSHAFPGITNFWTGNGNGNCTLGTDNGFTITTSDGSGYTLSVTDVGVSTLTTKGGVVITPPLNSQSGTSTDTDTNGNQITVSSAGVFTDTLNTTVLTIAGAVPSPTTFTYAAPGGSAAYTMKYQPFTIKTNFGCSSVHEYSSTTNVYLVTEIDLPEQGSFSADKYTFTYEPTPSNPGDVTGRLASVTLPTGGTIQYTYTGGSNGIECGDGSTSGLERSTPDTGSSYWTYTRSDVSGSEWTTTISDPNSPANQTVVTFQETTPTGTTLPYFLETERQIYQGSTSGSLLATQLTCYNGAAVPCNSTAVVFPIANIAQYFEWPSGFESETATTLNAYGLPTARSEYDYGSGAPGALIRTTSTSYASLSNGIVSLPSGVTITDSSGTRSQTAYNYDQTAVTSTSGTPQHVSVTGSRGNLTTISYSTSSSAALNETYTYYDTGNVNTNTDVNGAVTTYNYSTGSCGNSFATSINEPLSLSTSATWSCQGGVILTATDENNQTSTYTYSDAFYWRPASLVDAASDTTNFTYSGVNSLESALNFGSSTVDVLKTVDQLGRIQVTQMRQAPSSSGFDSVELDRNNKGLQSRQTLPYQGTIGQTSAGAPSQTRTYDALNRVLTVTDSGGQNSSFNYPSNDVDYGAGPVQTGENPKRRQLEHDASGRLSSVCEVTSATGSGSCAQTSPLIGFWTKYSYDGINDLTGVIQNAQASGSQQTRSYSYDWLGRLTSENNPESGITNYTFDSDSSCSSTSAGDLVKKIDAVGNTACYFYDALHRLTSVTYSGPYSANSPTKKFVYDAATVNGVAMAYAKTRMAEAYTCTSTCSSKITDIGFSYDVLGRKTDVYQSSPNSSGYYRVTSSYFPNGITHTIGNLVGLPTITYSADGEGRISGASASSGQNPLASVAYVDNASLVTQLNYGSSDSDSFTYDPTSNRITGYSFNVNGSSATGTLTWSAISTLNRLVIVDPFNTSNSETCAYVHDDLSRISSANCGSAWSQNFSSDAFGNTTKSGTISFQPDYSYLTNRITLIGSATPSYDANGNVLSDTAHTYTWNASGRPVTIDSNSITLDALDHVVEQTVASVTTETVYTPGGAKLALMSAQTLKKAYVPLAGGSVAVYNGSGLQYYRHPDWLGSSRLASTTTRAVYFDGNYAPYGEPYGDFGTNDLNYTEKNEDITSNLYDFPAREYNPIHGRWPSPDPGGLLSVDTTNPQTLNRYAYANNDPVDGVDPLGLFVSACKPTVPNLKQMKMTAAQKQKFLKTIGTYLFVAFLECESTGNIEKGPFADMTNDEFNPFATPVGGNPLPTLMQSQNGLGLDVDNPMNDPTNPASVPKVSISGGGATGPSGAASPGGNSYSFSPLTAAGIESPFNVYTNFLYSDYQASYVFDAMSSSLGAPPDSPMMSKGGFQGLLLFDVTAFDDGP